MLDEYKKSQPIPYQILKNTISKEKYSHAYLFETNSFSGSYELVMAFVKSLLCPNKYTSKNNCQNCKQCLLIESGNYTEIEIINPDGLWIKKEQLKKLQEEFSTKALIGNKKIYIINGAEKLNTTAANSILKFLEEPAKGIIAILITNNIYSVLETIKSRCQIIKLIPDKKAFKDETTIERLNISINKTKDLDDQTKEKYEKIIYFINFHEKNHLDTLSYMQKLWHDNIKTKEELQIAFDIMILYYKDILNKQTNRKVEIFEDYQKEINDIIEKNTILDITQKINIIAETKEKIKYNANQNLLMDKLIIDLEGGV